MSAWQPSYTDLVALVRAADNIRAAQRAYMENRGSLEHGRAVAEAAQRYDEAREKIIL